MSESNGIQLKSMRDYMFARIMHDYDEYSVDQQIRAAKIVQDSYIAEQKLDTDEDAQKKIMDNLEAIMGKLR